MTPRWSEHELQTIGTEHDVVLASRRPDGSLGRGTTIWIVGAGDDVFVRSAYGRGNRWFARAIAAGSGRITIGDASRDVVFEDVSNGTSNAVDHAELDRAYHRKYDGKYPKEYVDPVVDEASHGATLRLVPA